MRIIVIIPFFSSNFLFAQSMIGTYDFVDTDSVGSFHTLNLKEDSTYKFEYRGSSCFIWHDRIGEWQVLGNHLILSDTFFRAEEYVTEEHILNSGGEKYSRELIVEVFDRNGRAVQGVKMNYQEEGIPKIYETNENGIFSINSKQSKLWKEGGILLWDLPYKERTFFSGEIEIKPHTDSVKIQYNENPLIWQEIVKEEFIIKNDSVVLLPRNDGSHNIGILALPNSIFVKNEK